jgi:TPR repeat protein
VERPRVERAPQQRASAASVPEAVARPERNGQQVRPPTLTAEQKERAERMIANGDRHLEQGNIGAARMFFQRAAEAGLAAGAIKMAATYDPAELERLGVKVQGAIPDRAEARKWYERARALGSPEAEERLARIGGS